MGEQRIGDKKGEIVKDEVEILQTKSHRRSIDINKYSYISCIWIRQEVPELIHSVNCFIDLSRVP